MKYAIIIGDGMSDEPIEALNFKTPLEAANTPNMDALSMVSELGTVKNVPDKLLPGSDTAILSIFGCDPEKYYTGRSPLEAAGMGALLKENEISFRVNMIALSEEETEFNEKYIYSHNGDNISGSDSIALMEALFEDEEFSSLAKKLNMHFILNPSFRHIGVACDVEVPKVDFIAPHDILGSKIGEYINMPKSDVQDIQRSMMKVAYRVLNVHPINDRRRKEGKRAANSLWFWGGGKGIILPDFEKTYNKSATSITAVPLVDGIAALSNIKTVKVQGANGEISTNYAGKVEAAIEALKNGDDLAIVHIEAPDECSHMGDVDLKIKSIELLDEKVVAPMKEALEKMGDFKLLILPDHPTLIRTRTHDRNPVPYILYDSRKNTNCGLTYSEKNAGKGKHREKGHEFLKEFLSE